MNMTIGLQVPDFSNPNLYSETILFALIAYLIGSINFGRILSIWKKKSLSTIGSGNFGATNAGRAFGAKGFIFVLLGDFLKPFVAVLVILSLKGFPSGSYVGVMSSGSLTVALLFCLVGHIWPVYFKFKGGKGVATAFGILTIVNIYLTAIAAVLFLIFLFIFKRVSAASLTSIFLGSFLFTFIGMLPFQWYWAPVYSQYYYSEVSFVMNIGLLILVWTQFVLILFKHRKNIVKLVQNEENIIPWVKNYNTSFKSLVFKNKVSLSFKKVSTFFKRKNLNKNENKIEKIIKPNDERYNKK